MPEASFEQLPEFRGLEYEVMGDYPDGWKYYGFSQGKFAEEDIQNMAELGFNFVRVPVNTKFYFQNQDVEQAVLARWEQLDDLIEWGAEYVEMGNCKVDSGLYEILKKHF